MRLVSAGAHRLVRAQQENLPSIISAVRAAGPNNYVKNDHWAWYVWPTTKPGVNDPLRVAVEHPGDVVHMMAAPSLSAWTMTLDLLSEALYAQGSRRVFPSIDHGRIDYFIKEWSSRDYQEAMRAQPTFAAAVDKFFDAWRTAGGNRGSQPRPSVTHLRQRLQPQGQLMAQTVQAAAQVRPAVRAAAVPGQQAQPGRQPPSKQLVSDGRRADGTIIVNKPKLAFLERRERLGVLSEEQGKALARLRAEE